MKRMVAILIISLFTAALVGCGGKVTKTAQGTANAYLAYLKASKWKDAALLWDYDEQARRDNENWDDIVESQRKLIIDKLADEKAESLKMWETYLSPDMKVVEVMESGDTAKATIEGGRISGLDLVKAKDVWRISAME